MIRTVFIVLLLPLALSAAIPPECDSLFLSNGHVYAIRNLSTAKEGITFAFCDDISGEVHTAPWMQVHHIKRADGTVISGNQKPEPPALTEDEQKLEDEVDALHTMSILAFPAMLLFCTGIFLAIIVLARGRNLLKRIPGHPNENYLRRKIMRARRLARGLLIGLLILGAILLGYIIYFFSLFDKMQ